MIYSECLHVVRVFQMPKYIAFSQTSAGSPEFESFENIVSEKAP